MSDYEKEQTEHYGLLCEIKSLTRQLQIAKEWLEGIKVKIEYMANASYAELRPFVEQYRDDGRGLFKSFATPEEWAAVQRSQSYYAPRLDECSSLAAAALDKIEKISKDKSCSALPSTQGQTVE